MSEPSNSRADPSLRYGIVGALRFPAHEVQFGRVLHALCRSDEQVANAFCASVLEAAGAGPQSAPARRAQDLRERLADQPVRSTSEQDLFGAPEGVLKRRARRQGRIDLSFETDTDWRLGVELKFNDLARRGQQERYPAVGRPVVFVVRDPSTFDEPTLEPADAQHYLGVVAWEQLLDGLRELPVDPAEAALWRAVLAVSELNGDFARRIRRGASTLHDAEVLEEILQDLRAGYAEVLSREHGEAGRSFAEALETRGPRPGRVWAWVDLRAPSGETALFVQVRHTGSSQPAFRVSWYARHPLVHHKQYGRLAAEGLFSRSGDWWEAVGTVSPSAWRSQRSAALTARLADTIEALVRTGVMGRFIRDET